MYIFFNVYSLTNVLFCFDLEFQSVLVFFLVLFDSSAVDNTHKINYRHYLAELGVGAATVVKWNEEFQYIEGTSLK